MQNNEPQQNNAPRPYPPVPRVAQTPRAAEPAKPVPNSAHWLNLEGYIPTVTTAPTAVPRNVSEQVQLYVDSISSPTTKRLYLYSREVGAWYYVALT